MKPDDSGKSAAPPASLAGASIPASFIERRFWLEYGGHHLELRPGVLAIGRSASCQLVLDDALVSRRHAELTISPTSAVIRDLGSANGVFVNQKRINDSCTLEPGDRIVLGKQEMCLRIGVRQSSIVDSSRQHRLAAETLHGSEAPVTVDDTSDPEPAPSTGLSTEDSTHQGDALELLGSVADKVLALGRGAEAERILASSLVSVLDAARNAATSAEVAERAVLYAIKLAQATSKSRWVDYAFELYRILRRPLPAVAVDQLYTVLRSVPGVSLQGLRDYVAVLRSVQRHFGPNERFVAQRIEGLERLAALK